MATLISEHMSYHSLALMVADEHVITRASLLEALLHELHMELQGESESERSETSMKDSMETS